MNGTISLHLLLARAQWMMIITLPPYYIIPAFICHSYPYTSLFIGAIYTSTLPSSIHSVSHSYYHHKVAPEPISINYRKKRVPQ
jgi:hypothetical protein